VRGQDELERRLGDRKVRVAIPALGRFHAEQLAIEGDGLIEVVDVERELETRRGASSLPGLRRSSMS
jgi:hypothetical protein